MWNDEWNTSSTRAGVSRKHFLGTAGAASAAAFLAACGGSSSDGTTSAVAAGGGANVPDAPRDLTVVWALAAIGSVNTPHDVGFNDATRLVGWKYRKVGVPVSQYSPENVVKVINQAAVSRPDVLVTPGWVPGVYDAVADAQEKGILVILHMQNKLPEKARELGLTFVGADSRLSGQALGNALLKELLDRGQRSGVFLGGNTYPGNVDVEERLRGVEDAIGVFNREHGTSFTYTEFVDAASDAAKGAALYKAKMTQVGPSLVALVGEGSAIAVNQQQALLQQGKQPAEILVGGFDTDGEMPRLLKSKWVTATVDSNFYAQAFLPVMLAWQQKARGVAPGSSYSSGYTLITQENLTEELERLDQISSLAKTYGVKVA
jgi:ABC-type sugar transport system substrate-binding protein